jgi:hypothetical protein
MRCRSEARILNANIIGVRALANRDYLGDWFARTTHEGHSPFACTAPKILPWCIALVHCPP